MASPGRSPLTLLALMFPILASPAPGIKNFDKVDDHVLRGGQPTDQGFRYLAQTGVKTVIDLREAGNRAREEERVVTADGMRYINIPMAGLTPPTHAEITRILSVLTDGAGSPVFVHCQRGADRTGAVIAAYHITHDGWGNDRALKDAMDHGMGFLQGPRQDYVRKFQARTVDAQVKPPEAGEHAVTDLAGKN